MAMKYDEIKELYVATSVTEVEGDWIEGICGHGSMKNGYPHFQPLVMSGRQYNKNPGLLHNLAEQVASASGVAVTVRRFVPVNDIVTVHLCQLDETTTEQ